MRGKLISPAVDKICYWRKTLIGLLQLINQNQVSRIIILIIEILVQYSLHKNSICNTRTMYNRSNCNMQGTDHIQLNI